MASGVTKAATASIFPSYPSSPKFHSSARSNISLFAPAAAAALSLKLTLCNNNPATRKPGFQFQLHASAETLTAEEDQEEEQSPNPDGRRKLFVLNLPWSYSVVDIKKLFGECGTVEDVEIIKHKNGKSRGFAFVTMSSGEEAQAVIEKYDTRELVGRIIRVELARRFKKPIRTVDPHAVGSPPPEKMRHKLYVSNLAWKVRSNDLRELFSSGFNPLSVKVVFDSPSGRSGGYGFVSFATKEEAQSAISALDGKELLGRPISLKFSEKNDDTNTSLTKEAEAEAEAEESSKQQPQES